MILMDEFMVSGETIVRDLQLGIARATAARRRDAGGLPPRHVRARRADAPAPAARRASSTRSCGAACRPRSTADRVLVGGARRFARARRVPLRLVLERSRPPRRRRRSSSPAPHGYEAELGDAAPRRRRDAADERHRPPAPPAVARARRGRGATRCRTTTASRSTSLAEYLADAADRAASSTWSGELRSGARANVLMGVASNRVDVHRVVRGRRARRSSGAAEPLSALFLPADRVPDALLDVAWRNLVLNSAHDSSCACSADEVVDAVVVRYQEARHIGDGARQRRPAHGSRPQIDAPAGSTRRREPHGGRPRRPRRRSPCPATGPVHFVGDDGTPLPDAGGRTVGRRGVLHRRHRPEDPLGARDDARPRVRGRAHRTRRADVSSHHGESGVRLPRRRARARRPIDLEEAREELLALGEARRDDPVPPAARADARGRDRRRCRRPGSDGARYRAVDGAGPASRPRGRRRPRSANEHLRVEVDPADGTLTDRDDRRRARSPALDRSSTVATAATPTTTHRPPTTRSSIGPSSVAGDHDSSPVRRPRPPRSWRRTYALPDARDRRRARRAPHAATSIVRRRVRTTLELRTGERFLRVRVELDHRVRDHRLRAHFPLPRPVDRLRRGVRVRGGAPRAHRRGRPPRVRPPHLRVAPLRRLLGRRRRTGLALLHDGLLEYEVVGRRVDRARAHAAARHRLPLARRARAAPEPRRAARPARGPAAADGARGRVRGAPPPRRLDAADLSRRPTTCLVPLERVRGGGWPGASHARRGQPRSGRAAPRCRRCCATTRRARSCGS